MTLAPTQAPSSEAMGAPACRSRLLLSGEAGGCPVGLGSAEGKGRGQRSFPPLDIVVKSQRNLEVISSHYPFLTSRVPSAASPRVVA